MSTPLKASLFGLLLGLLGIVASVDIGFRKLEESVGLGLLFQLRGAVKAPTDAVVIAIDRESSERLKVSNNPDRWPRSLHARLVETLRRAGARVIVFDLYFIEPRSTEEDNAFAEAIKKAGNVVLAEQLKPKEITAAANAEEDQPGHIIVETNKPIEPILHSAYGTAPFVLPRMPVRVSQYWTFPPNAGDTPTFPVLALQLYALDAYGALREALGKASSQQATRLPRDARSAIESSGTSRFIRSLRQTIRGDLDISETLKHATVAQGSNNLLTALVNLYTGENRQYLNFYGPPRSVITVPYYQALQLGEDATNGAVIDLRGKAVFVGFSENLLAERQDSFHTVFSKANGVFISGVEIAATAFLNLLTNAAVKPIAPIYQVILILIWGLVIGILCRMTGPFPASIGIVLCGAAYLFAAERQFHANAIWFPIVVPLFVQAPVGYVGAILWDYFEVNKERKNVRQALGYYVPDEVVTQLARNMVDIRKDGQTVYGVCLFADIAGYTPVSEAMEPQELSELMHNYLEATFEPIQKHGGLVISLAGDAILAVWKGISESTLRVNACDAALGIANAVSRFNQSVGTAIKLPTRISVHAGPIFLGNLGARAHYEYGVTGDTVTTASRLDGLNKHLGTKILVSDEVICDLEMFHTREIGRFLLKGKTQPVVVYELLGRTAECDQRQRDACAVFAEAREAFQQRVWDQARAKFTQSSELLQGDDVSRFYLHLCGEYQSKPPPGHWDGTIAMDEK